MARVPYVDVQSACRTETNNGGLLAQAEASLYSPTGRRALGTIQQGVLGDMEIRPLATRRDAYLPVNIPNVSCISHSDLLHWQSLSL